jgi:pyrimidine operon attenuation protein/uracil phosphoribosyltransferase
METSDQKLLILNKQQIQQKIDRIAYQILEDNFDEKEIIIAGMLPRGNYLATRLKKVLDGIAPFTSKLITIDLDRFSSSLNAKVDFDVQECRDKVVILVDDVLNSGKSLAYGFGVFLDVPIKKLRTVVLVDRNHKSFPVTTDYSGIALSTIIKQHIDVVLSETGEEDAVYLR